MNSLHHCGNMACKLGTSFDLLKEVVTSSRSCSWSIRLATWQVTLTNMSHECEEPVSLSLKSSVTQTGLQTETPADQCLAVRSSMEDAWCTHHQGLKRSCHCRAQNRKHMLLLQLSWMPSSLGQDKTIRCWVLQARILMYLYLDSSAARGVCHVEVLDV